MKTLFNMTRVIVIFTLTLVIGCEPIDEEGFEQLKPDELTYLRYSKDSLDFIGKKVIEEDSVTFLYNSKDTIKIFTLTQIFTLHEVVKVGKYGISGKTNFYFPDSIFIDIASFKIEKDNPDDINSFYFEITTGNLKGSFQIRIKDDTSKIEIDLDTALVRGYLYNDVIKFEYPEKQDSHDFKKVFYAKKFGYIYIDSYNGNKLEMINLNTN